MCEIHLYFSVYRCFDLRREQPRKFWEADALPTELHPQDDRKLFVLPNLGFYAGSLNLFLAKLDRLRKKRCDDPTWLKSW